jgi:hypothetical protein
LLPVLSAKELAKFDRRELGYDRNLLRLEDVQVLHTTNKEEDDPQGYETCPEQFASLQEHLNLSPSSSSCNSSLLPSTSLNIQIWVYLPQTHRRPSLRYPIAQTYVDIMLRGCLSISKEFAQEFLQTTKGWHLKDDQHNNDSDADEHIVVHWVNDRSRPLYIRADIHYSQHNAEELDAWLHKYQPQAVQQRRHGAAAVKLPNTRSGL